MSDEVAERLAQRAAIAKSAASDPELLDQVVPGSVEETAVKLEAKFTVPNLREKAAALSLDVDARARKAEIAEAIAVELVGNPPEGESDVVAPTGPPVESDGRGPEESAAGPIPNLALDDDIRPIEGGGKYVQLRHVTRTLTAFGRGDGYAFLDPHQASAYFSQYLDAGYDLLFVEHLGIEPEGHMMLWGFALPNDPKDVKGITEVHHIVRIIGAGGEGAISGFQADMYVSSFLTEGWEIFKVKQLGLTPSGINVLWVLVR